MKNPRLRYDAASISSALLVSTLIVSATACGSDDGKAFDFAAVAPIVSSATPAGLKASSSASVWIRQRLQSLGFFQEAMAANATHTQVKSSIEAIFKGTFGKVSGGNGTGYINSNLEDLDSRVSELESRFTKLPTCMSTAPAALTIDFSNHADAKLALKVSCRDVFATGNGNQAAIGSGMVFGRRDKTDSAPELVSVMLLLKHKTSTANSGTDSYDAGFGYAGTIQGAGTDDEAVEMLFGQFNTKSGLGTSEEDQPLMARIYAKTKTKEFEAVMAATMPSAGGPISGGSSQLGCGIRMISNGTIIVIKGNYVGSGTCSGGTKDTVDVCVDATTLADVSTTQASACSTLAGTQFHIASSSTSLASFDYQTLTGNTVTASTNIFNALKPDSSAVTAVTTAVQ